MTRLQPGDVLVVATADKGAWWIRFRSRLMRQPARHNHVALFTHYDATGRPRGVEGRPGGFGWANLDPYLSHSATATNAAQPGRTDEDRQLVVTRATAMVGLPYDWAAILAFAATTARVPFAADEWPEDGIPSQAVCSSAVDYLYESVGWSNPGGYAKTRGTDPAAWSAFIAGRGWVVR